MPPWNSAKAKVQLRLSVQRLRTLQQKKEAQAKSARRDVALLLERGRVETAKVRVENIINEDIYLELLELLELYCELLIARFGLLDQNSREPDPGVSEGVCSIIYAAPRTELKELQILRDILMHKFGRDFSAAVLDSPDGRVSDRVLRKLVVATPSAELVDAYLTEIAKSYRIHWAHGNQEPERDENHPSDDNQDGGVKVTKLFTDATNSTDLQRKEVASIDDADDQPAIIDKLKPPKLPDIPPSDGKEDSEQKKISDNFSSVPFSKSPPPSVPPPQYDFQELARRFAALKKP